jgi:uncharacterized protein
LSDAMHLLDANVLIAMGDPNHVHHGRAQRWFHSQPGRAWATCPLAENAFLRIMGAASYPGNRGDPTLLRTLLIQMCAFPGHQFWADDLSLRDPIQFPALPVSNQLTGVYLLALAVAHRAKLATLDQRIDPQMVRGGSKAYFVIP